MPSDTLFSSYEPTTSAQYAAREKTFQQLPLATAGIVIQTKLYTKQEPSRSYQPPSPKVADTQKFPCQS